MKKYSIHDQGHIESMLYDMHAKIHQHAQAVKMATGGIVPVFDIENAIKASRKRYQRHIGQTSKYAPHQGVNEVSRRAKQIERGVISVN